MIQKEHDQTVAWRAEKRKEKSKAGAREEKIETNQKRTRGNIKCGGKNKTRGEGGKYKLKEEGGEIMEKEVRSNAKSKAGEREGRRKNNKKSMRGNIQ